MTENGLCDCDEMSAAWYLMMIVAWDRRYSVPIAAPGTPPEESVHTLTSHFQTTDLHGSGAQCSGSPGCTAWDAKPQTRPIKLIMLGFHCHSPACLGGKLWNRDTGELLCHVQPVSAAAAMCAASVLCCGTHYWVAVGADP
jgi:hypothetical protein